MTALGGVNGTVCNATQYGQFLQDHDSLGPSISCLTPGDIIGLVVGAEASFISCICVIVIFVWIGWNIQWYKKMSPNGDWKLFKRPTDIYMFSLFVFDFLQAFGGILNIKWAHSGIVTTGPYCTAQGIVQQIGELGVALLTLLLTVHTFVGAVWEVGLEARGVALGLLGIACVFVILCVSIGAGVHKNYETPTPYWCWISPRFLDERLAGEYIWMWIALLSSAILYVPLHFWAEGYWDVDEQNRFYWVKPDKRVAYSHRRAAVGMLYYPLAYSVVVLPITIARWLQYSHHEVSPAGTFFANSMFYLSGTINVILFLIIRPELLLFPRPKELQVQVDGQEMPLRPIPQGAGPTNISDRAKIQHSPEPSTSAALGEGTSREILTSSHVISKRISV